MAWKRAVGSACERVHLILKKALIILNHPLNTIQRDELKSSYGVGEFIALPDALQKLWSQVPLDVDIQTFLTPFKSLLESVDTEETLLIIQGEAGSCFALVSYALEKKFVVLHALAIRESVEVQEGEQTLKNSSFIHHSFRRYQ